MSLVSPEICSSVFLLSFCLHPVSLLTILYCIFISTSVCFKLLDRRNVPFFCIFCNEMLVLLYLLTKEPDLLRQGRECFPAIKMILIMIIMIITDICIYIGNSFFVCHTLMTVVANKYRRKWILMERPTVLGLICREV